MRQTATIVALNQSSFHVERTLLSAAFDVDFVVALAVDSVVAFDPFFCFRSLLPSLKIRSNSRTTATSKRWTRVSAPHKPDSIVGQIRVISKLPANGITGSLQSPSRNRNKLTSSPPSATIELQP